MFLKCFEMRYFVIKNVMDLQYIKMVTRKRIEKKTFDYENNLHFASL